MTPERNKPNFRRPEWWPAIRSGKATVEEFIDWLYEQTDDWKTEQRIVGNLQQLQSTNHGHAERWLQIQAEIEIIKTRLQRRFETEKLAIVSDIRKHPPTNFGLTKDESETMAMVDPRLTTLVDTLDELDFMDKRISGIVTVCTQRHFSILSLVKLRQAGLEEVEIE